MSVNLKSLIGKLNSSTRGAVEDAAKLAMSRTNHYIEVEHFLRLLLDGTDNDFFYIANHYGVNADRLTQEVDISIDKLKRGNARTPGIGESVLKMMTEAWTIGSIEFNAGQIRTGFALMALLSNEDLSRQVKEFSKELLRRNRAPHRWHSRPRSLRRRHGQGRFRQNSQPRRLHRKPHRKGP